MNLTPCPRTSSPPNMSNQYNSLMVLSWNCNSLQNKINELRHFIQNHPYIDIILLQETRNPTNNIQIPGFKLYYTPRHNNIRWGGTAVYIKTHIPHNPTLSTPLQGLDHTEITVNLPNFSFNVTSLYIPPTGHLPTNSLDQLFARQANCFIAGDYNCKSRRWNCFGNSPRGTSLHNFVSHHNFSLHAPSTPTRVCLSATVRPSIIDLAISKNFPYPVSATSMIDLSSDHLPVVFKIDLINPISPTPPTAINWQKFTEYLNDNILDFLTCIFI